MADRASAIIVLHRHILLIHRIRAGEEYYSFPGGSIEKDESAEEACIREVQEETSLQTAWLKPAFDFVSPGRTARFFFVAVQPGLVSLGGPEIRKQSEENRYILEWLPLVEISRYPLKPEVVRDALAALLVKNGPIREAADLAAYRDELQELLRKSGPG